MIDVDNKENLIDQMIGTINQGENNLIKDLININAEKKSYGFKIARIATDLTNIEPIEVWEITNINFYLS